MVDSIGEITKPYFLYMVLEAIVFILPIGALIWKAAKQSGAIEDMKEDFQELKKRVEKNEEQSAKDMLEIKSSMENIKVNNAEILTSLKFIQDSIVELKAKKGE